MLKGMDAVAAQGFGWGANVALLLGSANNWHELPQDRVQTIKT